MRAEEVKAVVSLDYLRDAIICSQTSELLSVDPEVREFCRDAHMGCKRLYEHILPMVSDSAFSDLIYVRRWRDLRKLEQSRKTRRF